MQRYRAEDSEWFIINMTGSHYWGNYCLRFGTEDRMITLFTWIRLTGDVIIIRRVKLEITFNVMSEVWSWKKEWLRVMKLPWQVSLVMQLLPEMWSWKTEWLREECSLQRVSATARLCPALCNSLCTCSTQQ